MDIIAFFKRDAISLHPSKDELYATWTNIISQTIPGFSSATSSNVAYWNPTDDPKFKIGCYPIYPGNYFEIVGKVYYDEKAVGSEFHFSEIDTIKKTTDNQWYMTATTYLYKVITAWGYVLYSDMRHSSSNYMYGFIYANSELQNFKILYSDNGRNTSPSGGIYNTELGGFQVADSYVSAPKVQKFVNDTGDKTVFISPAISNDSFGRNLYAPLSGVLSEAISDVPYNTIIEGKAVYCQFGKTGERYFMIFDQIPIA